MSTWASVLVAFGSALLSAVVAVEYGRLRGTSRPRVRVESGANRIGGSTATDFALIFLLGVAFLPGLYFLFNGPLAAVDAWLRVLIGYALVNLVMTPVARWLGRRAGRRDAKR